MHKLALLIAALSAGNAAAPTWVVHLHGAGPIRIGMSAAEVRRVLRDPAATLEVYTDAKDCAYVESKRLPKAFSVMTDKGRVVRVDITERGIRTASGAGVGDTEERIKLLYPGRITVERHHYDPAGHYLFYTPINPADRDFRLVFETDGKRVTSFGTGTSAATALVEGCA